MNIQDKDKLKQLNALLEKKVADLEIEVRQLKEKEEKYRKAFQHSPAAISITRLKDSTLTEVNDAFVQLTGFSREELIGHTTKELGIAVNLGWRQEVLQQVLKNGSVRDFEMTVQHKSGKLVEILFSIETITLNGEKFALNMIIDITERKRAEEKLEEVIKDLEAFSYSVSHDLRSPLRAIDGFVKIFVEDYGQQLDENGNRIVNIISANALRMDQLISNLLTFSQVGRKDIQKETVDMNELARRVVAEVAELIPHQAELKLANLHQAKADPELLHHVMFNLISNAIKYSSKKTSPVVQIQSEDKDNEVIFSVRDNGAGFDMKDAEKLFGAFQRLHSRREFDGTGVGLSIVYRIITKHGGKVWAEGLKEQGATFYFSLSKYPF